MRIRNTLLVLLAAGAVTASLVAVSADRGGASTPWAKAALHTADGTRVGTVTFAVDGTRTAITVRVPRASTITPNAFHAMHLHANDVPTNGDGCIADASQPSATWFVSADTHWKRDAAEVHGRHAGDLPSVYVNSDGTTSNRYVVDKLTPAEVVGRAVILHAGPDNFGNVPVGVADDQYTPGVTALAKTQGTGNAGDRFACGLVTNG